jgi:hypothetical protein
MNPSRYPLKTINISFPAKQSLKIKTSVKRTKKFQKKVDARMILGAHIFIQNKAQSIPPKSG